jgi:multidrug efflux pump subunit AcrB
VLAIPLPGGGQAQTQTLGNVASLRRVQVPAVVTHLDLKNTFDVYANVQRRDLGSVTADVRKVLDGFRDKLPRGTRLGIFGQAESMDQAFTRLGFGLLAAVVLIYFVMVVNFQSWLDPLIVISSLPAAFCGIVWMLHLTGTTFSVPSMMGAIMSVGVATANSVLLVSFANDQLRSGESAFDAAMQAGATRLRPVLMTAFAMMVGMLPMASGLGEGGEQNALSGGWR